MDSLRVSFTKAFTRLAVAGAVAALVSACGGDEARPPRSSPAPAASASSAAAEQTPSAALPSSPAGSASASLPSGASGEGGDAGPPSPKPVAGETKDECTPVGVDFEKRARPKLKECYAQGKKKNPNLEGTVKIKMTVDVKGKIKSVKVTEKTLPDAVADCMLKVVKATPFPEVEKCSDASLTIPITFPTPP